MTTWSEGTSFPTTLSSKGHDQLSRCTMKLPKLKKDEMKAIPILKSFMAVKEAHVLVFPWLAFGHMLPYLDLSKRLAALGIRVTFVSTPRNIQRLPMVHQSIADRVKFVELALPRVDGLPENCEATIDMQPKQVQFLKKAYDQLKQPLERILRDESPDMILFDFVACWVPEVAAYYNITCAYFSVFSAATLGFLGPPDELACPRIRTRPEDLTRPPEWFGFPSLVCHRPAHAEQIFKNLNCPDGSGLSSGERFARTLRNCDFVVVRSCRQVESEYLDYLRKQLRKPIIPVGLLPPILDKDHQQQQPQDQMSSMTTSTFEWLDKQEERAVLFVGFGSEYKMLIDQIHELAYGIEQSGLPFIWLLKNIQGYDGLSFLPSEFLERTSNKGKVSLGWAPQVDILAHPAIGGCLFHSGWGSIIEALGFGHPLILMPFMADQGLNAKLLAEKELGYEVPMASDGSFDREAIADSIRLVMVQEKGEQLRVRASQARTIFSNQKLQGSYIESFLQDLIIFKNKNTCPA